MRAITASGAEEAVREALAAATGEEVRNGLLRRFGHLIPPAPGTAMEG